MTLNKKNKLIVFIISFTLLVGIGLGFILSRISPKTKCENLFSQGEQYVINKKYDEALYAFKALIKIYPNCEKAPLSMFNIGKVYEFGFKDFALAKNIFKNLLKLYPASKQAKYSQTKISLLENFKWYEQVIKNFPNFKGVEYYYLENKFSEQKKDFAKALKFLISGLPENNIKSWLWLYLALVERKDNSLLKKRLERIITHYPFNEAVQFALLEVASINFREGRIKKSLEIILQLEKRKDLKIQKHLNYARGEIYFKQGKFAKAVLEYKKVQDFYSPENLILLPYFSSKDVYFKLGESLIYLKQYTSANEVLLKLLTKLEMVLKNLSLPESQQMLARKNLTLLDLGEIAEKQNKLDLALKFYDQIFLFEDNQIVNEETSAKGLYKKAIVLTLFGKNSLALNTFEKLINYYPNSYYLPWALFKKGKLAENSGSISSRYYLNILNKHNYSSVIIPTYYAYIRRLQLEKLSRRSPTFFYVQIEEEVAKKFGDLVIKKIDFLLGERKEKKYLLSKADILFFKNDYLKAKQIFLTAKDNHISPKNLNFVYDTLTPKAQVLIQVINQCDKENLFSLKLNSLLNNYNNSHNSEYLYKIGELYLEKGILNLGINYLTQAALKSSTQAIDLLQKNILKTFSFIPETNNLVLNDLNQLQLINQTTKEFKNNLQSFKTKILAQRKLIPEAILTVYLSQPENIKNSLNSIIKNLNFNYSVLQYKNVLAKKQFIFAYTPEQKFALKNLILGLKTLDSTLFQLAELVDIYFTSGMDPTPIWESKKKIIQNFYKVYLLPLEESFNLLGKFKITNGE